MSVQEKESLCTESTMDYQIDGGIASKFKWGSPGGGGGGGHLGI